MPIFGATSTPMQATLFLDAGLLFKEKLFANASSLETGDLGVSGILD